MLYHLHFKVAGKNGCDLTKFYTLLKKKKA